MPPSLNRFGGFLLLGLLGALILRYLENRMDNSVSRELTKSDKLHLENLF